MDAAKIKEALSVLPAKYQTQAHVVATKNHEFKQAEINLEYEEARLSLDAKARNPEAKERDIKATVALATKDLKNAFLVLETNYKKAEADLDSIDKQIQCTRTLAELEISETYAVGSMEKLGNVKDKPFVV